jgi:Replication-relaxation
MRESVQLPKGGQNILRSLAVFDYLTAEQVTRLCYSAGSITFVKALLKSLVDAALVLSIGGRDVNLPLIYTLSGIGRQYASLLGAAKGKRFRQSEEQEKGNNLYFLKHTIAVTGVLIAARLLSDTVPAIQLARMYTERELKRKIYVPLAGNSGCLEPDAGVLFRITETCHEEHQTWEEFFHIEVYRTHLRQERFKHKIHIYAAYTASHRHQELFHTPALAIAIFCADDHLAATLKHWTEEVLQEGHQRELEERFFFSSVNPATASPEEIFLSPVWDTACGNAKTPLLLLEQEKDETQPHQL